ncbi:hypothetical protein MMC26_007649 [Xylographa opegraphella]|nr:hypothetical protein [Xylographa opegraphella]
MYKPDSVWTWAFILITFIQAAIVLAFEGYVFAIFEESLTTQSEAVSATYSEPYTRTIPTFLTLFIFGLLYQLVLVWDALRMKNTIQVIGLCFYNVGLLIYAGVQIDQIKTATGVLSGTLTILDIWDDLAPFLKAIPGVIALGLILMTGVAWKLYDEFAWTIYKNISADLKMKRRYLTFQIYIALLKFDFFFFLGFTIQFVVVVVNVADPEFGLTLAAIPITVAILVMAGFWTRRENKWGMAFIVFLYFCAVAYFIFKLVRMYNGSKVDSYIPVRKSLTIFAVITVILIIITIVNAIACTQNFDTGLKRYIEHRKFESEDEKSYMTEMPNLSHGPATSRMMID